MDNNKMVFNALWEFPISILSPANRIPMSGHPGSFGAVRTHDIHTGVDLYLPEAAPTGVHAVEDGVVVAVEDYTGKKAGSPWWNDTKALLVEGKSGVVCYGEIDPMQRVGDKVKRGNKIGHVIPVLDKSKIRPDIKNHSNKMLHIELYSPGTHKSVVWALNTPKPENLHDPTSYLIGAWIATTQLL